MGLEKEVREVCYHVDHDMSVLADVAMGGIANCKPKDADFESGFQIIQHGFDRAMGDAWKTAAEIRELVLHHPGSKDSVKWYNPMTWVNYALQRGNFNNVLSNIDTYLLTCARGHLYAAREGDIWKSVKYFAELVASPEFKDARDKLRRYQGGEIHAAANPKIALDVLPPKKELSEVRELYLAAFHIQEAAEPIKEYLIPIRRAIGWYKEWKTWAKSIGLRSLM